MKDNKFADTVPTVGLNVESIKYRGMNFTLWDVSGQATRLWKHYFDKINAIIFVVDSADRDRMSKVSEELHKVIGDGELSHAPILIFANKQDLPNAMTKDEVYEALNLKELEVSRKKDISFQGCSAKSGEGIWEGIG